MIFNPKPGNTFLSQLFKSLTVIPTAVHITVDTHLTADLFAISLIIDAGVTLYTDNYRIYVLTFVLNNGTISNDGANGGAGTAIAGGTAVNNPANHTLRQGINGKNGGFNISDGVAGSAANPCIGGTGGSGGNGIVKLGGIAGVATVPDLNLTNIIRFMYSFSIASIKSATQVFLVPNSGSGSGAADTNLAGGGASGSGAGIVFIFTSAFTNNGLLTCKGGNGGDAFDDGLSAAGGGACGSGGIITVFANSIIQGTTNIVKGTSGLGKNGGQNGSGGNNGSVFFASF